MMSGVADYVLSVVDLNASAACRARWRQPKGVIQQSVAVYSGARHQHTAGYLRCAVSYGIMAEVPAGPCPIVSFVYVQRHKA